MKLLNSLNDYKVDNERYLDIYKGLAMVLVVFCQTIFAPMGVLKVISSFAIGMLFISQGVGLTRDIRDMTLEDLWRGVKNYMIPYLSFSLIIIVFNLGGWLLNRPGFSPERTGKIVFDTLTLYGYSVLWVFPVMGVSRAAVQLLRKRFSSVVLIIILALLTGIYIILGGAGMFDFPSTNTVKNIFVNLFTFCWRTVIFGFFIEIGDIASMIPESFGRKKYIMVPIAFSMLVAGLGTSILNIQITYDSMQFGNVFLFFGSVIFWGVGFLWICEWIGIFPLLEFVGCSARIIFLTYIDFKCVDLALLVDDIILEKVKNRFISHSCYFLVLIALELILIFIFSKYLYLLIGKERSNPFLIFKRQENKDDINGCA